MKIKKFIIFSFVFIYILFLYCDVTRYYKISHLSIYIKFIGIALCFLLSLLTGKDGHDATDTNLLVVALFFTLIADYCFLFEKNFKVGVILFCIVQWIYMIRHSRKTMLTPFYFLFISVIMLTMAFLALFIDIDGVDQSFKVILFLYGGFLLASVFSAIRVKWFDIYPEDTSNKVAIALLLFMLCDINVALFNTTSSFSMISGLLIWVFYFPSQVLLSLSGYKSPWLLDIFKKNK